MKTPPVTYIIIALLLAALGILLRQETAFSLGRLVVEVVLPLFAVWAVVRLYLRFRKARITRKAAKQPEPNLVEVSQAACHYRTRHTLLANGCFRERQDLQRHRNLIVCIPDGTLVAVEKAVKACQAAECLHRTAANRLLALKHLLADIDRERDLLWSDLRQAIGADVVKATGLDLAIHEVTLVLNSISDVEHVKSAGQATLRKALRQIQSSRIMAETRNIVESGQYFDVMTLEEEAVLMEEAELIVANMAHLDLLELELLAYELHEEALV